eukprot:11500278-Ditylum_brightwellii.AAC.1
MTITKFYLLNQCMANSLSSKGKCQRLTLTSHICGCAKQVSVEKQKQPRALPKTKPWQPTTSAMKSTSKR